MEEYQKIQTVFMRDPATKMKKLLAGQYSLPEIEYLKDCEWVWTEKVDGTNTRVSLDENGVVELGGRTNDSQIPATLVKVLQELFTCDKMAAVFDGPACLYGEGYGAKIQKRGENYKADGVDFVLFDVKIGRWWLRRKDVEDIAGKLGIPTVPMVMRGTIEQAVSRVRQGFESAWGAFPAEGLVGRPREVLQDRGGERIITKIKQKDFV